MDINGQIAVQEALRRRAGLGGSGAGISGGMPASNVNSPTNPISNAGMTNSPVPSQLPQGVNPVGSTPSDGAISAMNKAQPGEAQLIVKALIGRLNKHPVDGQPAAM